MNYEVYRILFDRLFGLEVRGFDSRLFNNLKCGLGLKRDPPNLVRTIGWLLDCEVADLIKKGDVNRLDGA